MIFGEIKGLRPHGGIRMAAAVLLGIIELVGLFGYLGGFADRTAAGSLEWHEFQWDTEAIVYTVVMWACWAALMAMVLMSRESRETKVGGAVLVSLPVAIFVMIFFELIELSPP